MVNKHRLGPLPQSIVIVRSLPGLGDLLCAVPAWRALRAAFPEAQITLVGLPWVRSFVERFSKYLDKFLEFPSYPGIPEVPLQIRKLPAFFTDVQQQNFDLGLQMHGSGIVSNGFTVLLGARINAGFYLPAQYCPDVNTFLPYPTHEPEIWRQLRLMEFLGIPLQGTFLEFPLWEEDFTALDAVEEVRHLKSGDYVCIHPGASVHDRRWSPEKFAVVADAIAERGFQVVLTGTAVEAELTQIVQQKMHFTAIDLAGRTSLGAIAAFLKNARLLICNDTGVSHLAAALRVRSVVIFSTSDPNRWAPLDRDRHRVLRQARGEQEASPLHEVTPAAVIAQAEELLAKEVTSVT